MLLLDLFLVVLADKNPIELVRVKGGTKRLKRPNILRLSALPLPGRPVCVTREPERPLGVRGCVYARATGRGVTPFLSNPNAGLSIMNEPCLDARSRRSAAPARLLNTQAWLLWEAQDLETALRLDREAAQMAREFGDVESECNSHINAARDHLSLGEPARALEHLRLGQQLQSTDFWFRWVYHPRLQGELASYWITQGDLKQAALHAAVSLEGKNPKRRAWAHKLQGDIAVLEERVEDARQEFDAALRMLEQVHCPIIQWRILKAAAELADRRRDISVHDALRARARAVVWSLAMSIREKRLRKAFLSSKAVREL
jgi:tetratricopeptide (TPR) repeat protein